MEELTTKEQIDQRWAAICAACTSEATRLDMLDGRRPGERVTEYVRLLLAQREPWYPAWGR